MATGAAGTGKTFEVSYALTGEEIKLLAYVTGQKRARIAPFRHYYVWVFITGIALSYSGGAIAHSYYGVPLDLRATALVMALFASFIAGAMTYRWLVAIWTRRISAWRLPRLKETAHLRMNKDGFVFLQTKQQMACRLGSNRGCHHLQRGGGSLVWSRCRLHGSASGDPTRRAVCLR